MPPIPGVIATPTVMLNALLGSLPEDGVAVRGPDRVAAVLPMYEEEVGASEALRSVLSQRRPLDEVVVSINGGRDATPYVVRATLRASGYRQAIDMAPPALGARAQEWRRAAGGPVVTVLQYPQPTAKAASLNDAVLQGYISSERVLVMDGDTVLAPDFVERVRDHFYRLRVEHVAGRRRYVIEDVALQSGAVTSRDPGPDRPAADFIARARTAEYAFAALLRRGQTRRVGGGRVFGCSRLYTVVGCGFAARRDLFPVPADTLTEDHDFTLAAQNVAPSERAVDVATLEARGFEVVIDGVAVPPSAVMDRHDDVVLRRGGEARFVSAARMETEDPPHVSGYVRQVERWTGGGIENALKRGFVPSAWRELRPNVRFAFVAAQVENLVGLLLLMMVPVALGLHVALPGVGLPLAGLAVWFAFDLSLTVLLTGWGFVQLDRARGLRSWALLRSVAASVARSAPAFAVLKYVNPILYVTAVTRAVPAFWRARRGDRATTVTWERPHTGVRGTAHARAAGVALVMMLNGLSLFAGVAYFATAALPDYRATWLLGQSAAQFDFEAHAALPMGPPWQPHGSSQVGDAFRQGRQLVVVSDALRGTPPGRIDELVALLDAEPDEVGRGTWRASHYCPADAVAASAGERRFGGDAGAYFPLNPWGRLVLARMVPLLPHLEEAASAYDLEVAFLLQMLLNESYLDPLAVGPTDDVGLAQITADALALLAAISDDPDSPFANPHLLQQPFNLFDPEFSICAGAAKLAWARAQPGGDDDGVAYARYINPLVGVVRGRVSDRHAPLVEPFMALRPLVDALGATVAAYRLDPAAVAEPERALLALADEVALGDLATAYERTGRLVAELEIDDRGLYRAVLEQLYGDGRDSSASLPAQLDPLAMADGTVAVTSR